jgi:hypothetical protein
VRDAVPAAAAAVAHGVAFRGGWRNSGLKRCLSCASRLNLYTSIAVTKDMSQSPFIQSLSFLPKLPGFNPPQTFSQQPKYRPQCLQYVSGQPIWKTASTSPLPVRAQHPEAVHNYASRAANDTFDDHSIPQEPSIPAQNHLQAAASSKAAVKALSALPSQRAVRFKAFGHEEMAEDCSTDGFRIHEYAVTCFVDDDTFAVKEFGQPNSGMWQGTVLKRNKCVRPDGTVVTWKDLRVGQSLTLAGREYHFIDCDLYSRKIYREVLGVEQGAPMDAPKDPFQMKLQASRRVEQDFFQAKEKSAREALERADQQKHRFLTFDRHVLRFYCFWDDDRFMRTVRRRFALLYYLADGTCEMIELPRVNLLRNQTFLKRQKIPTKFKGGRDVSAADNNEYLNDDHLMIGACPEIFNRAFFIYDVDEYTKQFYMQKLQLDTFPDPIDVSQTEPSLPRPATPPHNGFGSFEDSLRNTQRVTPKAPLQDARRYIDLNSKPIRFDARWISDDPECAHRRFVVCYYALDQTVSVFETTQKYVRNCGLVGGKFLDRCKLYKTDDQYHPEPYQVEDFYVGARIQVFGRTLELTSTDERSQKNLSEINQCVGACLFPRCSVFEVSQLCLHSASHLSRQVRKYF